MPVNEYTKKAIQTYRAKHKQISILVTPEDKEKMVAAAEAEGLSMKEFILKKCLGEN